MVAVLLAAFSVGKTLLPAFADLSIQKSDCHPYQSEPPQLFQLLSEPSKCTSLRLAIYHSAAGRIPHQTPLLFHGIDLCLIQTLPLRVNDLPALISLNLSVGLRLSLLGGAVSLYGSSLYSPYWCSFDSPYWSSLNSLHWGNFNSLHLTWATDVTAIPCASLIDLRLA